MAKKRKKPTNARKLYLKAERLWKEIAYLRDGRECQVKKHYPHIKASHCEVLQIDHFITRRDKNLFFDPHNSTVVCSSCNRNKKYKQKGVDYAIQEIVLKREGQEAFDYMMRLNMTGNPNLHWKKIWWIEYIVETLEKYKEGIIEKRT